jgi:hypothetical protein
VLIASLTPPCEATDFAIQVDSLIPTDRRGHPEWQAILNQAWIRSTRRIMVWIFSTNSWLTLTHKAVSFYQESSGDKSLDIIRQQESSPGTRPVSRAGSQVSQQTHPRNSIPSGTPRQSYEVPATGPGTRTNSPHRPPTIIEIADGRLLHPKLDRGTKHSR